MKDFINIRDIENIQKLDNLSRLIPTYLQNETREKVKKSILKLNKPKLKLRKEDLTMS